MTEDHYKEYKKLIYKEAWRKAKLYGLDFQDLIGEGNLAYCEALETWDPEKGAFSTHLTWRLKYRFGEVLGFDASQKELGEVPELAGGENPLTSCSFKNGLETLSSDAKEVANIILGSSGELCDMTANKIRVTRKNIARYYRSKKWQRYKVVNAMNEIRDMLKTL